MYSEKLSRKCDIIKPKIKALHQTSNMQLTPTSLFKLEYRHISINERILSNQTLLKKHGDKPNNSKMLTMNNFNFCHNGFKGRPLHEYQKDSECGKDKGINVYKIFLRKLFLYNCPLLNAFQRVLRIILIVNCTFNEIPRNIPINTIWW